MSNWILPLREGVRIRVTRLPHTPSNTSRSKKEPGDNPGFAETAKNKLGEAKETVAGVTETVKEKVTAVSEAASRTAEDLGRHAQDV